MVNPVERSPDEGGCYTHARLQYDGVGACAVRHEVAKPVESPESAFDVMVDPLESARWVRQQVGGE